MPARPGVSHSCEFFQDTTYNHRCLANPFFLLQSLYSLKMAFSFSIFFCLCFLQACFVSFEEKKKKREIVLSMLAQVSHHPEAFITNHLQRQAAMQTFLTLSVWRRTFTGPPVFPEDGIHSAQSTKGQHFC